MKKFEAKNSKGDVIANMPGMVRNIKIEIGDVISKDQPIVILEAMKMENIILSPIDGIVAAIPITVGQSVIVGDLLMSIQASTQEKK
jgi:biotin carboxyl carrier protein